MAEYLYLWFYFFILIFNIILVLQEKEAPEGYNEHTWSLPTWLNDYVTHGQSV